MSFLVDVGSLPVVRSEGNLAMSIDFASEQQVGLLIGLIAVSGGLLIGLSAVVGGLFVGYRKMHLDAELKMQMVERGMSADEIKEVLAASTNGRNSHGCSSRARFRESSRFNA
jgi:hypothetical protein